MQNIACRRLGQLRLCWLLRLQYSAASHCHGRACRVPEIYEQPTVRAATVASGYLALSSASAIRRALLVFGILLLGLSAVLLLGVLFKLLPADVVKVAGHSGLRAIGAIAVAGCLLAALGSDDS